MGKHYVYVRIPVKVQKMINPVIITFAVSAYWHGFYPGYYLFFTLYAFYYIVEEAVDKKFKQQYIVTGRGRDAKPISATRYKLYIVVATLATWVYINSITITFRLLDWKRTNCMERNLLLDNHCCHCHLRFDKIPSLSSSYCPRCSCQRTPSQGRSPRRACYRG